MRVELTIGGADQVKAAFRSLSDELDKLNRKLDATAGKLAAAGQSAGSGGGSGGSGGGGGVVPPPIVPPPVIPGAGSSPHFKMGMGSNLAGSARNAIAGVFNMLPPHIKVLAAAFVGLALAAVAASKAMTEFAQYSFIARGSVADKNALAGISGAANVGLDEAGQIAASKPGGSKQLLREIDILRNTQGEEMAARYAQAHGIEGFRSVRSMTDGQYQRAMNQPQVSGAGQRVNDRLTTEGNLALKELTVNAQKALIPVILNMTVVFVNLVKVVNLMIRPFAELGEWLADWADKLTGGDHNDAAKKQLKAAEMNMDSANKISDSIHGGGARVRGAIPENMGSAASWMYNQQYVQRQIRQLGGIN